jgi:hypothetical protein
MNPFKGKLLKDGVAIAENIEGRLTIDPAPTGGEWWSSIRIRTPLRSASATRERKGCKIDG